MYYIGNSIIKGNEIAPLTDQRFTGVDGELYELFKVEDGKALFLNDHLERFAASIIGRGKTLPEGFDKLPRLIEWLILVNGLTTCNIRLCLSADGLFQGGFVVSDYPTRQMYEEGIRCMVLNATRENPSSKIYHADMRNEARAQQESQDVYESILVNEKQEVTEGSRSNLFFVKGDIIYTASDDKVLGGIIRKKLIDVCLRNNIKVELSTIKVDDLKSYDAAFMTSTPVRVMPISAIVGSGGVTYDVRNALMRRVMDLMEEEVSSMK